MTKMMTTMVQFAGVDYEYEKEYEPTEGDGIIYDK